MHILLVADGRSPITQAWISALQRIKARITLLSTYPCPPVAGVDSQAYLPVAFSALSGSQAGNALHKSGQAKRGVSRFRSLLAKLRHHLGPFTLPLKAGAFRRLVAAVNPDLVHALRVPFEGMLASYTPAQIPLVISTWGNDLTLHAPASPWMRAWTRRALRRADGLLSDACRDLRLAPAFGLRAEVPRMFIPGNGGLDLQRMDSAILEADPVLNALLPPVNTPSAGLVLNPRGIRPGYVCNDTFFQAIPLVLQEMPDLQFACASMAGQPEAGQWVARLGIEKNVTLLPFLSQESLWRLFKRADLSISVTLHDGTPNSLLEAMAAGCLPIAGDIESLRDWITPGVNGLLVEPRSPQQLARAILEAMRSPAFRRSAAEKNRALVETRADQGKLSQQLKEFYEDFLCRK